jgi:threonine dehydrogenase-like Zn-dependent dehydrogenase
MRQGNAVLIPKDIAFEEAVFMEPLACCINAQLFGASSSSLEDFQLGRSLLSSKRLTLAPLITHRFLLSEIVAALNVAKAGESLKAVVYPHSDGGW